MSNTTWESRDNEARPRAQVPQAVLVCGVDIDGSTALKIKYPYGSIGISRFMSDFDQNLRCLDATDGDSEKDGWFLWRVRGDELVYFRVISVDESGEVDYGSIDRYVNQFIKVMEYDYDIRGILLGLHGYSFLLQSNGNDWEFRWNLIAKNGLSNADYRAKVENWEKYPAGNPLAEDVFSRYNNSISAIQKDYHIDFIGRDVDLGFRISEYSHPHYFVLSPRLARCLLLNSENSDKDKILFLGFHELKGCAIGGGGPERFPLYFLPIKSKGESMNGDILLNYESFIIQDSGDVLEKFEEYERRSCEYLYKRAKEETSVLGSEVMNTGINNTPNIEKLRSDLEELKKSVEKNSQRMREFMDGYQKRIDDNRLRLQKIKVPKEN
ncbi:MAG: hypothetical protein KH139_06015 [Rothia mucilaginosa]|jgi:hypothetical protein|uniref:hypothetical protein n=1 Tax=Rothia mucilaginosa TaxID=43675 RepID=UPI001DE06EAC|nr:hypothetical protein [Rothia mucilaginosa]MBS6980023.1 hypothetical protein [Rothia mucilaginosa]